MKKLFLLLGIFVFLQGFENFVYASDNNEVANMTSDFQDLSFSEKAFPPIHKAKSKKPFQKLSPAESLLEEIDEEKGIFGVDTRIQLIGWGHESLFVKQPTSPWEDTKITDNRNELTMEQIWMYPDTTILSLKCVFIINDKFFTSVGTAVMIHDYLALTAAHNVFSKGECARKITCSLMRHGNKTFKQVPVKAYALPKGYAKNKFSLDYAVLCFGNNTILDKENKERNVADFTGYLSFLHYDNAKHKKGKISGYPGHRYDKGSKKIELYGKYPYSHVASLHSKLHKYFIYHEIHTSPGQSGAPVRYYDDIEKEWKIIGIHVAGGPPSSSLVEEDEPSEWINPLIGQKVINKAIKINEIVYKNIGLFSNYFIKQKFSVLEEEIKDKINLAPPTKKEIFDNNEKSIGNAFYINYKLTSYTSRSNN